MATRRRSRNKTIAGNLTDVQKRLRYLEVRPNPDKLASKSVATKNIALRAIQTDLISDSAITRRTLAQGVVGTAQIENLSITNSLIAENAVTGFNIAPDAVSTSEIATGAVTNDELGTYAVTNLKLGTDSIDNRVVAPDAIGTNEIINESVTSAEVGVDAIGNSELANGAVDTANMVDGSVTDGKVFSISGGKITGTLPLSTIPSLPASRVTSGVFSDTLIPAITADKVPSLDAAKITTGTFPIARIPNLTADKITSGTLFTSVIPTLDPTKVTGLTSVLTTANVSGTGISRTFSTSGSYRSLDITINAGTGSNQLAIGNHTHASAGVPDHTHTGSLSLNSLNISGGAHGHVGATGSHSHGFTPSGYITIGAVSSTIKVKKDITDYVVGDVKNILNLKMKRYKYKNSARDIQNKYNREWMYGYIAEEVQDLGVEQILAYDKNGDPDAIDYGLLSVLILELVKVQQNEINSLSEEIKRLKDKI
jgi:hypothetical protein